MIIIAHLLLQPRLYGTVATMTPSPILPATRFEIAAWLMMAVGLLLTLTLYLLPALLAGLLVVQLDICWRRDLSSASSTIAGPRYWWCR